MAPAATASLMSSGKRRAALGYTYLAMLFAVATAGAVAATGSVVWHQQAQRDREREMLRVGGEIRRAIGLYYERSPGTVRRYPQALNDLLLDTRHLTLQRYLRRIYRDPLTAREEWGVVPAPSGGIMGVYSLSTSTPVKTAGFEGEDASFNDKQQYAQWKFVYAPSAEPAPPEPGRRPDPSRRPQRSR
jgi:hypothetical protein